MRNQASKQASKETKRERKKEKKRTPTLQHDIQQGDQKGRGSRDELSWGRRGLGDVIEAPQFLELHVSVVSKAMVSLHIAHEVNRSPLEERGAIRGQVKGQRIRCLKHEKKKKK